MKSEASIEASLFRLEGYAMKRWITLLVSILMAQIAHPDVAPYRGGVSVVIPAQSSAASVMTDITLDLNTVKMHVSTSLCRTRAWFKLRNTGAATELDVGFPMLAEDEAPDFTVLVNDDQQVFEDRSKESTVQLGLVERSRVHRWKVWPMKFAAQETKFVEVRYSNLTNAWWSPYQVVSRYSDNDGYTRKERERIADAMEPRAIDYLLITGSYWKEKIKRCRVEVTVEGIPSECLFRVSPPARSVSSRSVLWEWYNWRPDTNVRIVFFPTSPKNNIIPLLEEMQRRHPKDGRLGVSLNSLKEDFLDGHKVRARFKSFIDRGPVK